MRTIALVSLAVLAAVAPGGELTSSAIAAPAAGAELSCVMLLPDDGGTLINRCESCREVTLERMRLGESIPNIRAMMLPGDASTVMPFRGPGRTRIIGERACPPPPGPAMQQAVLSR